MTETTTTTATGTAEPHKGNGAVTRESFKARLKASAMALSVRKTVTIAGIEVELRRPSLSSILELEDIKETDRQRGTAMTFIMACYIPGTDDRVFQDSQEDIDFILSLEFTDEIRTAFEEVTGLMTSTFDSTAQEKNSETLPLL